MEQPTPHPLHRNRDELEAALEHVLASPRDAGRLELIVRRPAAGERETLEQAELDPEQGLVGDSWRVRGSSRTADGGPHPDMQLTLMNIRVAERVAGTPERRALAGDQLFVDLDLSRDNLPPGTRLRIGEAEVEITATPHTGCRKFVERFGRDAMLFVNDARGKQLNLRGVNARVIRGGCVRVGDAIARQPLG